jgi:radical SAM protein with 4Fe4S-binding SPASM domain
VQLLHALQAEGLPFFVTFLLCGATAASRSEISGRAWELWKAKPSFAEIYTPEEADAALRFTHISSAGKSLVGWHSPPGFYSRVQWNTCLYGTFEISADGCVYPCAGLDAICARTEGFDLRSALAADSLYEWWQRNKESLDGCKRCALRLACADCTAAELAGVERPELKSSYCPYDPDGKRRVYEYAWHQTGFADFGTLSVVERENLCPE